MKKTILLTLGLLAAVLLSGCAVYGAKEPFCTPEESLQNADLLFQGEKLLGNEEEKQKNYQKVFYSVWNAQKHAYCYVLQEITINDQMETRIDANTLVTVRYFRHAGNYYADVQFDTDDSKLHHLCLVGVLGSRLVFLDMAHYSMVKTNTFNGLQLPAIAIMDSENGEFRVLRKFSYEDFKSRLS